MQPLQPKPALQGHFQGAGDAALRRWPVPRDVAGPGLEAGCPSPELTGEHREEGKGVCVCVCARGSPGKGPLLLGLEPRAGAVQGLLREKVWGNWSLDAAGNGGAVAGRSPLSRSAPQRTQKYRRGCPLWASQGAGAVPHPPLEPPPPPALHTETGMLAPARHHLPGDSPGGASASNSGWGTGDAPAPTPATTAPQEPRVSCSGITIT